VFIVECPELNNGLQLAVHRTVTDCRKHVHSRWLRFTERTDAQRRKCANLLWRWSVDGFLQQKYDPLFNSRHNGRHRTGKVGHQIIYYSNNVTV